MSKMESENWNTTKPFRIEASFNFRTLFPLNTLNGLKDESNAAGYKPFKIVANNNVPSKTFHIAIEVTDNSKDLSVTELKNGRQTLTRMIVTNNATKLIVND